MVRPCPSSRDLFALSVVVVVMVAEVTAANFDLQKLLKHQEQFGASSAKRVPERNPCKEAEKPFPCSTNIMCIPMRYVCDESPDCPDESDENSDMCTALNRPPVEDIEAFLMSQKKWILPNVFGNQNIRRVAHGLAVCQTLDDLSRRLHIGSKGSKIIRRVLEDVYHDDQEAMEKEFGMPSSAWNEVRFFFSSLIKAGFH